MRGFPFKFTLRWLLVVLVLCWVLVAVVRGDEETGSDVKQEAADDAKDENAEEKEEEKAEKTAEENIEAGGEDDDDEEVAFDCAKFQGHLECVSDQECYWNIIDRSCHRMNEKADEDRSCRDVKLKTFGVDCSDGDELTEFTVGLFPNTVNAVSELFIDLGTEVHVLGDRFLIKIYFSKDFDLRNVECHGYDPERRLFEHVVDHDHNFVAFTSMDKRSFTLTGIVNPPIAQAHRITIQTTGDTHAGHHKYASTWATAVVEEPVTQESKAFADSQNFAALAEEIRDLKLDPRNEDVELEISDDLKALQTTFEKGFSYTKSWENQENVRSDSMTVTCEHPAWMSGKHRLCCQAEFTCYKDGTAKEQSQGFYQPRQQLHQALLTETFADKGPPQKQPIAFILIGTPASGRASILRNMVRDIFLARQETWIDAVVDDIKEFIVSNFFRFENPVAMRAARDWVFAPENHEAFVQQEYTEYLSESNLAELLKEKSKDKEHPGTEPADEMIVVDKFSTALYWLSPQDPFDHNDLKRPDITNERSFHMLGHMYLHREALFLQDMLFLEAVARGHNLVLQKTMTARSQVTEYVQYLNDHGYQTFVFATIATPDAHWASNVYRSTHFAHGAIVRRDQLLDALPGYYEALEQLVIENERDKGMVPHMAGIKVIDVSFKIDPATKTQSLSLPRRVVYDTTGDKFLPESVQRLKDNLVAKAPAVLDFKDAMEHELCSDGGPETPEDMARWSLILNESPYPDDWSLPLRPGFPDQLNDLHLKPYYNWRTQKWPSLQMLGLVSPIAEIVPGSLTCVFQKYLSPEVRMVAFAYPGAYPEFPHGAFLYFKDKNTFVHAAAFDYDVGGRMALSFHKFEEDLDAGSIDKIAHGHDITLGGLDEATKFTWFTPGTENLCPGGGFGYEYVKGYSRQKEYVVFCVKVPHHQSQRDRVADMERSEEAGTEREPDPAKIPTIQEDDVRMEEEVGLLSPSPLLESWGWPAVYTLLFTTAAVYVSLHYLV